MTGPHSVLSFPTLSSLDFLSTLFTSWSQHSRCSSNCCCFVSDRKSGEVPGVKKVLSLEVDCLYLEGTASLGISTCIALPASIWHTPHPHPTSHHTTQVPLAREIGKWTILVFPPPEQRKARGKGCESLLEISSSELTTYNNAMEENTCLYLLRLLLLRIFWLEKGSYPGKRAYRVIFVSPSWNTFFRKY